MFIHRKILVIFFILLITNCSHKNFKENEVENFYIEIVTPMDKHNVYLKENLKRLFGYNDKTLKKYILNTDIVFNSLKTLSAGGQNYLQTTRSTINYSLTNSNENTVLKNGSINTYPALSASSSSLYSQQKSLDHIKERLIRSAAKSLYMHIKIILRRLN